MVFSSSVFLLVFLPVVLVINRALPFKMRNAFLLIANLVFYAYGEPVYILLMLASIVFNYFIAIFMEQSANSGKKKAWLIFALIMNIGSLCFFKYTVLFVDTLRKVSFLSFIPEVQLRLPVGISFYTFQAVSYIIDVYRGDYRSSRNFVGKLDSISKSCVGTSSR